VSAIAAIKYDNLRDNMIFSWLNVIESLWLPIHRFSRQFHSSRDL